MYNKVLADLIRQRLENELEKIKLELFEDDNYAEDIEDSVAVVKKQLSSETNQEDTSEQPKVESPVVQEIVIEKKPEPVVPSVVQEMNLEKDIVRQMVAQENVPRMPVEKEPEYDRKKIATTATLLFLAIFASIYFIYIK